MSRLTKERIVDAAQSALVQQGHEEIALRGLARDLGVTAPALYDHFSSKDDLLRALAEQGYFALIEATEVGDERAIDRLRSRALAYVAFAAQNAELFRLMFLFRPAAVELVTEDGVDVDNELSAASQAFDQGAADLTVAISDGDLADRDVTELGLILWSAMHGVATIATTAPELADSVAPGVIDTLLAGLQPT